MILLKSKSSYSKDNRITLRINSNFSKRLQGPIPKPWTGTTGPWSGTTGPWSVRNRIEEQEVKSGPASKASCVLAAAPRR